MSADDEEIERQAALLRERWKTDTPRKTNPLDGLDDDQKRMAARVVGREGIKSYENARRGRPVRVAPVVISYEWHWYRTGGGYSLERWYWRISRVENGRQREVHADGTDIEGLNEALAALKAKGIRVVDVNHELAPAKKVQPKVSRRKAILEELRYIRR